MKKLFAIALVLMTLSVTGCGKSEQQPNQGDRGTTVTEVVLRNGVPCAVMDKSHGKSLSCDWREEHRRTPSTVDPQGDKGTSIRLVTLPSGTQCASMDADESTALSCNW